MNRALGDNKEYSWLTKRQLRPQIAGSKEFRRWLEEAGYPPIDLSGAKLQDCDLRWTNFAGANLEGVDFSGAVLTGAYFGPATFQSEAPFLTSSDVPVNLRGASFEHTTLLAATFNYPELRHTSFSNAYMGLANFRQVKFEDNSFGSARLVNTAFSGCEMAGITGLDTVQHYGPSHIDFEEAFQRLLRDLKADQPTMGKMSPNKNVAADVLPV